jgi:hypothetical protein
MMNNDHITIFVELSEQEKLLEQGLEQQRQECTGKLDTAIKHGVPIKEFIDLEEKLRCSIRDLKGGVYAPSGFKMPKNSTELAQGILLKAQNVAYLEEEYIDRQLGDYRDEMQSIKTRIESIISFCIEHQLDQTLDDFMRIIKRWKDEKTAIFEKPERCEPAYGVKDIPMLEKNLIGYYIKKLIHIKFLIGELNYNKINRTQFGALISICDIVKGSSDDNRIFDQLFLMGQYASNLNSIESNLNGLIAKQRSERSASSKSDWANELAEKVYLKFWIYGNLPTTNIVEREFPQLLNGRTTKTIGDQLTNQRKYYSNIDNRVPPVTNRGRNKKV